MIVPERMMSPAKRITTIDSKIKLIASRGRDRLASLARSKMGAIHQQEALTTDLLETLKENRGFTPQFLQSQWEAQKTLQLSARAYNDQAGMKKFAKLLEAERSAQAHSDALDAVKKELDRISLARTMSHRPMDLKEHYQAALHVRSLHDESQARLHELTAQIGLSDLKLPQNPSDKEKEYIEKYILARFCKHSILIRLAKYQDEMNPIRSSQRCGGRLVTKVGYTKMVSVLSSANKRARIISTQVRQYNELVDYLECSERPPWLPDSLSHTKMNVKELLQMDPSDERWAKMWETLWNSNWSLDEKPPAFVIDQEVRHGIVAVLSLARIKEEKLRLAREELNAHTWIVESFDSLVQIVDSIHSLFKYRLRLRLKSLLKCRDSIINGSTPNVNLWRAPIRHLLENLERPDPTAAPSYIDYTSFHLPLPYSSTLPSGNNSIDPDDDVEVRNELSVLDGLIRMSPESDLGGAEDIEPPIDSASGSDDLDVPGDISDDESEAPLDEPTESAETDGGLHAKPVSPEGLWSAGLDNSNDEQSIEEKFWNENPRPQSLPPITTIIDAIRSPGQSVQEQMPKKIWKEIMELHLPRETERIANDGQMRYYKHISIFCDALPTVNRLRRIHGTIIDTYIEMLKDLTDKNLRDVLRTTRPRVIMFPTQCEGMRHHLAVRLLDQETKNVRTDLFEVTSWTIPCYSRKRSHWLLGVVNFEKRELRYLDSIPLPETFDISHHGPQWVFAILGQLVDAIWSFVHPTRVFDWSNWGSRVVTKLASGTDTTVAFGLWLTFRPCISGSMPLPTVQMSITFETG
ncbi:uncharacterized protein EI90DRAFT_172170 [Cantharellus anzutake]|uniref:uncharacterized protein n=1 Tax=Cantharellus anzutake TaxID=1750568 RepID=UPI0019035DED|nr:uncharacterized protein EI90DRAFT_172170 [Cantharellus anzutake]KAF8336402.1 hypothetical protein EI90DRAFT_172170 [Cantharellus anzutake]